MARDKKLADGKKGLPPGLYIVSTPIGNLGDITLRALEVLRSASLVACEDTRVTRALMSHYGISARTVSLHDYNEAARADFIMGEIGNGASVALVSDAGTPLVSDPGYKLAHLVRNAGLPVTAVPGATSVIDALVLSGMPSDRFMFVGFAPAAASEKRKFFDGVADVSATVIFFESANRLLSTLGILNGIMPDRKVVIARELTKVYEEVKVENPALLIDFYENHPLKGEIVGLIAPAEKSGSFDGGRVVKLLARLLRHMSLKDASAIAADEFGCSKNEAYKLGLKLKGDAEC
jgi:16S rRNA (cytidine1402-2'-O)-methyltransferase